MTQFDKRNISMMMDLYEMTMANGYFANQQKPQKVVFDVFYRKNPDQGGYAVFAGLEQVVEYAENLHFDSADIDYFRSLNLFSEEFLQYLKEFRFTGDIYAFPEGTVMYPNEPVITVVAPLIDAQLIETAILMQVNQNIPSLSDYRSPTDGLASFLGRLLGRLFFDTSGSFFLRPRSFGSGLGTGSERVRRQQRLTQ